MKFWMGVAFAEPGDLFDLARAADDSGFHGLTVSDHVFYPRNLRSPYPYSEDGTPGWQPETSWPDPFVTIGALSAITSRLQFTTNVYVAPARDLFTAAKAISTAAVLSGERLSVGVAPGWCEEEFEQMGQPFRGRGKRLDEMIAALRVVLTGDWASFSGDYYNFDELKISPAPSASVPFYIGGDGPKALQRAAAIGDGWIGALYKVDEAFDKVAQLKALLREAGREHDDFEIILSVLARDDLDLFRRLEEAGVTAIVHAPWILARPSDGQDLRTARLNAIRRFGEEYCAPLAVG